MTIDRALFALVLAACGAGTGDRSTLDSIP